MKAIITKKYLVLFALLGLLISCSQDSSNNASAANAGANQSGKSGSLARFTTFNNYLYTVDQTRLNVFNIADKEQPVYVNSIDIGFDIETLYSFKNYLYIGSRFGMYIYKLENPETPMRLSRVEHITACDPVVGNFDYAYVTLHSGTVCGNNVNRLEVYDVSDMTQPQLISTRNLMRPIGLSLYHDYLIVCDDEVKIFNVSQPEDAQLVKAINVDTFDVIVYNDLLILVGKQGVYQYKLNPNNIQEIDQLSFMPLQ